MALFTIYQRIPYAVNIIVGPSVCYFSILMNICIFFALFDKSVKTPSTVLMQGLAIADGLTALCTYGFEPILSLYYEEIGLANKPDSAETVKFIEVRNWTTKNYSVTETKKIMDLPFPWCVFHYYSSQLAETFHLVSVLLTSSLGIQKLMAVACPLWSRIHMTVRSSLFICFVTFLMSLVINIPKLFVIKFHSKGNESTCSISPPDRNIEMYTLTYHPMILAVTLSCALVSMLLATCYIVFILLTRKQFRGHASSSKNEKRSCMLILAVMVVFLLSEIPRIYLNTVLFKTYSSDVRNENIALNKVESVIESRTMECYLQNQQRFLMQSTYDGNTTNDILQDCPFDYQNISLGKRLHFQKKIDVNIHLFYNVYVNAFKDTVKPVYGDIITDIIKKNTLILEKLVKQVFLDWYKIEICSSVNWLVDGLNWDYEEIFSPCDDTVFTILTETFPFLILGSSSYSEPMNYYLNIVWGQLDISLHQLKLILEILKICTVFGCASNFVIYIAMSEKLRNILIKKLKCRYGLRN